MKINYALRAAAVVLLIVASLQSCVSRKVYWKGIYIGQSRDDAHRGVYDASEYLGSYCITDLEQYHASLTEFEREAFSNPSRTCIKSDDMWIVDAQCFLVGRPCSESIRVKLENDQVSRISVHWYFAP